MREPRVRQFRVRQFRVRRLRVRELRVRKVRSGHRECRDVAREAVGGDDLDGVAQRSARARGRRFGGWGAHRHLGGIAEQKTTQDIDSLGVIPLDPAGEIVSTQAGITDPAGSVFGMKQAIESFESTRTRAVLEY